ILYQTTGRGEFSADARQNLSPQLNPMAITHNTIRVRTRRQSGFFTIRPPLKQTYDMDFGEMHHYNAPFLPQSHRDHQSYHTSATDQKLHCPPQSMMICSAVESALNYLATDRFAKINYGLRARIQTRHLHQLRAPEQSTHGRRRRLGIALSCSAGHRIEAT